MLLTSVNGTDTDLPHQPTKWPGYTGRAFLDGAEPLKPGPVGLDWRSTYTLILIQVYIMMICISLQKLGIHKHVEFRVERPWVRVAVPWFLVKFPLKPTTSEGSSVLMAWGLSSTDEPVQGAAVNLTKEQPEEVALQQPDGVDVPQLLWILCACVCGRNQELWSCWVCHHRDWGHAALGVPKWYWKVVGWRRDRSYLATPNLGTGPGYQMPFLQVL